jgi:hypothetical protein
MLDASHLLYAMSLVEKDGETVGERQPDLINLHISPSSIATINDTGFDGMRLVVDTRVMTVDGPGVIVGVVESYQKVDVRLDKRQFNGSREVKLYDYAEVKQDDVGIPQREKG